MISHLFPAVIVGSVALVLLAWAGMLAFPPRRGYLATMGWLS